MFQHPGSLQGLRALSVRVDEDRDNHEDDFNEMLFGLGASGDVETFSDGDSAGGLFCLWCGGVLGHPERPFSLVDFVGMIHSPPSPAISMAWFPHHRWRVRPIEPHGRGCSNITLLSPPSLYPLGELSCLLTPWCTPPSSHASILPSGCTQPSRNMRTLFFFIGTLFGLVCLMVFLFLTVFVLVALVFPVSLVFPSGAFQRLRVQAQLCI